ncbi:hypothetical protein CHGG_09989 [Chaetomium globosum CBS 148.51]|uniref:Uncharacterized protein n=1 Tax=Chaetomium globosum (strain ATCC 6205 / CBS 148.51 / DSM 1962 / NBRC 6347 / NRRL 1970) TaxID=306901 RepID=Q2GPW5_CHAGB|nr:uncharacterized protein CHGG_09989 [Chaetomium globosum CBS 148.51]EAQ83585.1 hypothetical protein CHGG_09989 [Chaetomium globosum CBS 148.51]
MALLSLTAGQILALALTAGLTLEKLQANSAILIIGGSETTATLLSGVTYFLLTNHHAMETLTAEIRETFKSEDEIDFASVSTLPYLLACLDEALRMYPPVPTGLPRVVPKGGANIAGNYVPEKTVVAVHHWAMYHNDEHFKDPFAYHPERWLDDPAFAGDHKEAFQPFHLGPRNCLGKNLAYIEMRLILVRILWNFDLRIAEDSLDWMSKQRIYNLWEKGEAERALVACPITGTMLPLAIHPADFWLRSEGGLILTPPLATTCPLDARTLLPVMYWML